MPADCSAVISGSTCSGSSVCTCDTGYQEVNSVCEQKGGGTLTFEL